MSRSDVFGLKHAKRPQIAVYDETLENEGPVQQPVKQTRLKGLQDITNTITNRLRDADLGTSKRLFSFGDVYKPKGSSSRARTGSRGPSPTTTTISAFDDVKNLRRGTLPSLVPISDMGESGTTEGTSNSAPASVRSSPHIGAQPMPKAPPSLQDTSSEMDSESTTPPQISPLDSASEFFSTAQKKMFHIRDTSAKRAPPSPRRQVILRSQAPKKSQPKSVRPSFGSPKPDFDDDDNSENESSDIVVSPSRVRGLSIDTTIPSLSVDQNMDSPRFFESPTPTERGMFGWQLTAAPTGNHIPRVTSHESIPTPKQSVVYRTGSYDTIVAQDRKSGEMKFSAFRSSIEKKRTPPPKRMDNDGDHEMGGLGTPPVSPTKLQSLMVSTSTAFLSPSPPDLASPTTVVKMLSPDPKAFDEQLALEKKSLDGKNKGKPTLPPTPDRNKLKRSPLVRTDSLWENKILKVFFGDGQVKEISEQHQIGQGAFFTVFRVKEKHTGKIYAVKKAKQTFRGKQDRLAYLKEVEVAAHLKPHENVIKYYQAWQESGYFCLQMEYCNCNLTEYVEQLMLQSPSPPGSRRGLEASLAGKSISTRGLAGHPKITNEFLADVCRQISQGLKHIHNAMVLHLDIKPDNILVSTANPFSPVYKLADFGHASLKKDWKDGGEGDSMYMAPELLLATEGEPLSPRSPRAGPRASTKADIFSLGLLLFEIATGAALPSTGSLWHKLRTGQAGELLNQAASGAVARALHPGLKHLVLSMLSPFAEQRPHAEQILTFLAQLTFSASPSCTPSNFDAMLKPSSSSGSGYFWNHIPPRSASSSVSSANSTHSPSSPVAATTSPTQSPAVTPEKMSS